MRGRKKERGKGEGRGFSLLSPRPLPAPFDSPHLLLSSGSFNMALSRANCALKENACTVGYNMLRNVMPQYTTKQDFPAILFSHPTLSTAEYSSGIFFLIRVHNYTRIKGLDSGKITSLPNNQNLINLMRHFSHRQK